jgi:hypothetical protein
MCLHHGCKTQRQQSPVVVATWEAIGQWKGCIAEIDADAVDSCFHNPNDCGGGDEMGVNPRLAAPAGMTGAGVTAAEGSAYGCVGSSSGGRSVGATAFAGGGGGDSSNKTDGCDGGDGGMLADLMWWWPWR